MEEKEQTPGEHRLPRYPPAHPCSAFFFFLPSPRVTQFQPGCGNGEIPGSAHSPASSPSAGCIPLLRPAKETGVMRSPEGGCPAGTSAPQCPAAPAGIPKAMQHPRCPVASPKSMRPPQKLCALPKSCAPSPVPCSIPKVMRPPQCPPAPQKLRIIPSTCSIPKSSRASPQPQDAPPAPEPIPGTGGCPRRCCRAPC